MQKLAMPKACPKCGGDLMHQEDEEHTVDWACFQCGKTITEQEAGSIRLKQAKESARTKYKQEVKPVETTRILPASTNTSENIPKIIPPRPSEGQLKIERRKFYHANKAAIMADVQALGEQATREKWNIGKKSWAKLVQHWNLRTPMANHIPAGNIPESKPTRELPGFPAFNDHWQPETQVAWFNAYLELAKS